MKNSSNKDKHYAALGLRRGATQEEIHAAFRYMEELYPLSRRKACPDARARFYEVCNAYLELQRNNDALGNETPADITKSKREMDDFFYFPKISLRDYFFRLKLVIVVVGSLWCFYVAMKYISLFRVPLTDESSARLLRDTIVFFFVSWSIFWCVRFTITRVRMIVLLHGLVLGIIFGYWINFVTLSQEISLLSSDPYDPLGDVLFRYRLGLPFIMYVRIRVLIRRCSAIFRKRRRARRT